MKTSSLALAGTSLALLVVAAAASAGAATSRAAPPPPAPERGSVERQNSMKEALATPLEDVNIRKVQIPDVLKRAVANPYDLRSLGNCAAVGGEIRRIDDAIGRDFDTPEVKADESTLSQAKTGAATVTRVGAQMLMPLRGVVRQLSGANAYQREVTQAIEAGSARRGFLKAIGMRMNCAPPAAPYGFRPAGAAPARPAARPRR